MTTPTTCRQRATSSILFLYPCARPNNLTMATGEHHWRSDFFLRCDLANDYAAKIVIMYNSKRRSSRAAVDKQFRQVAPLFQSKRLLVNPRYCYSNWDVAPLHNLLHVLVICRQYQWVLNEHSVDPTMTLSTRMIDVRRHHNGGN